MKRYLAAAMVMGGAMGLMGCEAETGADAHEHDHAQVLQGVTQLVAVIHPTEVEDSEVTGWVRLVENGDGTTTITAEIHGLAPGQHHGFHVHEFGDCTADDATSAGGHYNPEGHEHGLPDENEDEPRHAGDLGNLEADENGVARFEKTVDNLTATGTNAAIGRAVIVHRDEDVGTQPVGDAGPRLGCGVLGVAQTD